MKHMTAMDEVGSVEESVKDDTSIGLEQERLDVVKYQPQGVAELENNFEEAVKKYEIIRKFRFKVLKDSVDFGVIPGTDKPTLLKPGAEKLCDLLKLCPRFKVLSITEDFDKPLFYYRYECELIHTPSGNLVGSAIGSCNSMEAKYRYRNARMKCPQCNEEALILDKFNKEVDYFCFPKKGGCGAKYKKQDLAGQKRGKVENDDIFTQINTLDKMAQKRALIAAVMVCAGVSEFFTQDMEDVVETPHLSHDSPAPRKEVKAPPPRMESPPPDERSTQEVAADLAEQRSGLKAVVADDFKANLNKAHELLPQHSKTKLASKAFNDDKVNAKNWWRQETNRIADANVKIMEFLKKQGVIK
jgi:hypothetical protein